MVSDMEAGQIANAMFQDEAHAPNMQSLEMDDVTSRRRSRPYQHRLHTARWTLCRLHIDVFACDEREDARSGGKEERQRPTWSLS